MSEKRRSTYAVGKAIREAMSSPTLFPNGKYRRAQMAEILIKNGIVEAWEITGHTLVYQVGKTPGWSTGGAHGGGVYIVDRTPPKSDVKGLFEEPSPCPPGTFHTRVARIERMLERICTSLQISTD